VDRQLLHLQERYLVNDMDQKMLVLHQHVVDSFQFLHLLDEVHRDALQNLDVPNLDVLLSFLDEAHLFLVDVVVGVELRHQLKMDCYQDVVGVKLRHQLKTDCYQDVEQSALLALPEFVARHSPVP
jgi:hypothetical protein